MTPIEQKLAQLRKEYKTATPERKSQIEIEAKVLKIGRNAPISIKQRPNHNLEKHYRLRYHDIISLLQIAS